MYKKEIFLEISRLDDKRRELERNILNIIENLIHRKEGNIIYIKSIESQDHNIFIRYILDEKLKKIDNNLIKFYYYRCIPTPFLGCLTPLKKIFPRFFKEFIKEYNNSFENINNKGKNFKLKNLIENITYNLKEEVPFPYIYKYNEIFYKNFLEFIKSQKKVIIFFIENIHWVDISTLKFFKYISKIIKNYPILFILTSTPEVLNKPFIPPELKNKKVSIIHQLKAMKLPSSIKVGKEDKKDILNLLEENTIFLKYTEIDNKIFFKFLNNFLSKNISSNFKKNIIYRAQGNIFFFIHLLIYLKDNILKQGKNRWILKYKEEEISIPNEIDNIIQSNLESIIEDENLGEILELMSINGGILLDKYFSFQKDKDYYILYNKGIVENFNHTFVLLHEKLEKIIKDLSFPAQLKKRHDKIFSILKEKQDILIEELLFHCKQGSQPYTSLNYFFLLGKEAEELLSYENAYFIYREASQDFSETYDIFIEEIENIKDIYYKKEEEKKIDKKWKKFLFYIKNFLFKEEEEKKILIEKFINLIDVYRISAISNSNKLPLFSEDIQKIIRRIASWDTSLCSKILSKILIYLLEINILKNQHSNKVLYIYPEEDIKFLIELIIKKVLSYKENNLKVSILRKLESIESTNLSKDIFKYYEKIADKIKEDKYLKSSYYLISSFWAFQKKDYFHASRILHKNIKYCHNLLEDQTLQYFKIESLRLLGEIYQIQAQISQKNEEKISRDLQSKKREWESILKEFEGKGEQIDISIKEEINKEIEKLEKSKKKEEKDKIYYATQSTLAYIDAINQCFTLNEFSTLAYILSIKAKDICEKYYLEDEIITNLNKEAEIKLKFRDGLEFKDKVLIILEENEIGILEFLESLLIEENLYPEIKIIYNDEFINIEDIIDKNKYNFIIYNSFSNSTFKESIEKIKNKIDYYFYYEEKGSIYIKEDIIKDRIDFIIETDTPSHILNLLITFFKENPLRKYI